MQQLTNKDVKKIYKLNQQLVKIEQKIDKLVKKEYRQILKKLSKKINKINEWELEVEIDFYNNDKIVHTLYECYKGDFTRNKKNYINDGDNHNVASIYGNAELTKQHHCLLLHSLYDDSRLTWEKIFYIDNIIFDIKPIFQYEVKIDDLNTHNIDLKRMEYLLANLGDSENIITKNINNHRTVNYKNCSIEFNGNSEDIAEKLKKSKIHLANAKEVYIKLIVNENITMHGVDDIIEQINNSIGKNTNITFATDINNSIDINKYEYQIIITGLEEI